MVTCSSRGRGPTKVLGLTGTDKKARVKLYTLGSEGSATIRFDFHENGNGYSFRLHGTQNNCWNSRDQYLALWDNPSAITSDAGSRFTFTLAREIDASTGLNTITLAPTSSSIYDLSGRRIERPSKGIYIIGGRKMVVK